MTAETETPEPIAATMTLTLRLSRTDDAEITCIACGRDRVEYEFRTRAAGRRSYLGIHRLCARKTGDTIEELE